MIQILKIVERGKFVFPSEVMRPPTTLENPSTSVTDGKILAHLHRLFAFLLAAAFAFVLVKLFVPMNSGWPEASLILLAAISTLTALTRQLPVQNVLLAAFGIALVGGAASALGAISGIPFGPFMFFSEAGPKIFKTLPWAMPLVWIIVVLNSRGVARLILRPWRKTKNHGFRVIGLTAGLTALFDLALDPFAAHVKHYWLWEPTKFPLVWQGAPLVNFFSWALVTILILAFVTPALIRKQPRTKSSRSFHPLAVWLGGILLFAVASAQHGLWAVVAVDAVIGSVTAVFAVRGAKW